MLGVEESFSPDLRGGRQFRRNFLAGQRQARRELSDVANSPTRIGVADPQPVSDHLVDGPPISAGSSLARPPMTSWLNAACFRREVSICSSTCSRTEWLEAVGVQPAHGCHRRVEGVELGGHLRWNRNRTHIRMLWLLTIAHQRKWSRLWINAELWIESPRYRFSMRQWDVDTVKTLVGAVFRGDGPGVVEVVRRRLTDEALQLAGDGLIAAVDRACRERLSWPRNARRRCGSAIGRGTRNWPTNFWRSSTRARRRCFARCRLMWTSCRIYWKATPCPAAAGSTEDR